jgi:hypothetical protein
LAILVLVAIFSFIVVPSMQMYMGDANSAATQGPVIVRWRGGELRRYDVVRMVQSKGQTVNFLAQVANEVIKRGGMPNVPGFRYDFQNNQIQSLGISGFVSELAVARTHILNEKAKQLGIVFDDIAIDTFIIDFVNSKLSRKELNDIMDKVSGGELTDFRLYQTLKLELAAQVMESTALAGLNASGRPIMSPGQAWQYFDRLNRQVRMEGFPVLVADYLPKISEQPSEAEVTELYEKYKEQFSSPTSAEPGFRKRYQTNLDVIEITSEPYIVAEVAKLAPDQVRAEYDRRVSLGQYRRPAASPPASTTPPADTPATPPADTPATPPADTPATPPAEIPATPPADTPATPPAEIPATPPAETPATPPTDTPATPSEPPAGEPKKEGEGNQSQIKAAAADPVRLVSFQETNPAPQAPAGDAPAAETPAAQPPAAETPAAEKAPAQTPPATEPPAAVPAGTQPPPVEAPPGLDAPATTPPPATAATTPPPAAPAEEIIPFEEVKDEISRSMVLPIAREKMEAAVASIQKPMLQYFTDYGSYKIAMEMDASVAKEPTRPDIKKLAEAAGLPYRQTGMVDITDLIRSPLGRSRSTSGETFAERVFTDDLGLFQPFRTLEFDFTAGKISEFLVWKLEAKQPYIPELAEVRDDVVAAWKKQKAEKLAEADAAELAKKLAAGTGDDVWKSVVKEEQLPLVVKPTLFTWMTGANQFSPFLSEVEGVDTAGPEFMQKVFATTAGQSGVAPNGPRTIFYVYRVVEFLPDAAELEKRFATDTIQGSARTLAFNDAQEMFASWYGELEKELEVKWIASDEELD